MSPTAFWSAASASAARTLPRANAAGNRKALSSDSSIFTNTGATGAAFSPIAASASIAWIRSWVSPSLASWASDPIAGLASGPISVRATLAQ